jgi:hypothetical protein
VIIQDRSVNIDRFVFGWGDGSSNYTLGQTNSHVYNYPYSIKNDSLVTYTINLLAIGQNCVVPYTDTITVYPRPVVSGFAVADSLCSPALVSLLTETMVQEQTIPFIHGILEMVQAGIHKHLPFLLEIVQKPLRLLVFIMFSLLLPIHGVVLIPIA